jgi:hypothetical protein
MSRTLLSLAGFQVIITGRFWVIAEDITAGILRYVGKETDRKWEEGDEISVLEFKATEFGRAKKVVADPLIADKIRAIGIRKTMELTKMSQHTIEKLIRGQAVKRQTHENVLKAIRAHQGRK